MLWATTPSPASLAANRPGAGSGAPSASTAKASTFPPAAAPPGFSLRRRRMTRRLGGRGSRKHSGWNERLNEGAFVWASQSRGFLPRAANLHRRFKRFQRLAATFPSHPISLTRPTRYLYYRYDRELWRLHGKSIARYPPRGRRSISPRLF